MRCHHRHRQHFLRSQTRPTAAPSLTHLVIFKHINGSDTRPHLPSTVPNISARHTRVTTNLLPQNISPLPPSPTSLHRSRLAHNLPLAKQSSRRRPHLRETVPKSIRRKPISIQKQQPARPSHPSPPNSNPAVCSSNPYIALDYKQHHALCHTSNSSPSRPPPASTDFSSQHKYRRSSPRSGRPAARSRCFEVGSPSHC